MSTDPSNPDTLAGAEGPSGQKDRVLPASAPEITEADAAEQLEELEELEEKDGPLPQSALGEANPADAAEQARVVEIDDEDYR